MHLLIMGAPGSGKGTCAVDVKERYSIPHISTGEIFRKAISEQTPTGVIAQRLIDKGQLVPDDITNQIVKERLAEDDCKVGFLLDGYPRTLDQAEALTRILDDLGIKLDAAINLEIDDEAIEERIVNRRLCSNCGKGYNIISLKPQVEGICDDCKAPLYQRKDDTSETVKERLEVYNKQTKPIIAYYEKLGLLVNVNSNQPITEVVNELFEKLEA